MDVYKDIDLNFGINIKNDIAKKTNENSILQSLKNIVMIKNKLFYPNFGANIKNYLFSTQDEITLNNLRDNIEIAIRKNEPRINQLKINLEQDINNNRIKVDIYYSLRHSKILYFNVMYLKILK